MLGYGHRWERSFFWAPWAGTGWEGRSLGASATMRERLKEGQGGPWGCAGCRTEGLGRGMGGMLTASSCRPESYSVFEIFRCCGARERSLGLGGSELSPSFSSDLSSPREEATGTAAASANPSTQPSWQGRRRRGRCLQPMGSGTKATPPHPCWSPDSWPPDQALRRSS